MCVDSPILIPLLQLLVNCHPHHFVSTDVSTFLSHLAKDDVCELKAKEYSLLNIQVEKAHLNFTNTDTRHIIILVCMCLGVFVCVCEP